jgi:hypothetical protein
LCGALVDIAGTGIPGLGRLAQPGEACPRRFGACFGLGDFVFCGAGVRPVRIVHGE